MLRRFSSATKKAMSFRKLAIDQIPGGLNGKRVVARVDFNGERVPPPPSLWAYPRL
jgi:hypothetical protein